MAPGRLLDTAGGGLDNDGVRAAPVLFTATILALTVAAGGCHRHRDPASCDKVGARVLALAHQDLDATKDLEPANRRGVEGLLAPMRDAMVRACREDGWAKDARACYVGAADVAALRACDAMLTEPQRELMRKAASKGIQAGG